MQGQSSRSATLLVQALHTGSSLCLQPCELLVHRIAQPLYTSGWSAVVRRPSEAGWLCVCVCVCVWCGRNAALLAYDLSSLQLDLSRAELLSSGVLVQEAHKRRWRGDRLAAKRQACVKKQSLQGQSRLDGVALQLAQQCRAAQLAAELDQGVQHQSKQAHNHASRADSHGDERRRANANGYHSQPE